MLPSSDQRLRAYARVLARHRTVIVAITALVLLLGLAPALLADPTYASTATIRVRSDAGGSPFDEAPDNAQTRSRELLTLVEVIDSAAIRDRVVDRLGPGAAPFDEVTPTLVGFSEVIELRARASSPGAAADAANAYAEVVVEELQRQAVEVLVSQSAELRRRSEEATQQIAAIDAQLADPATSGVTAENLRVNRTALAAQVLDFSARADELDVDAALREGRTEIVTRATPQLSPVSPKPLRSGLTAGVLGLLAGVAVAVVLDLLQDRTSSAEDLADIDRSVPLLASVPHMERPSTDPHAAEEPVREAFRHLRTSVKYRSLDAPIRSLVITSGVRAEGKTTAAAHLALAFAEGGTRVVLMDADLRRPSVHRSFGLVNAVGLSSLLAGEVRFGEAVEYVQPSLAVLPAGPPTPAANELLDGAAFRDLVRSVSEQADLVIVDVPPALPVADPLVAARAVDGVIVVSRIGVARRREVRTLLRRLQEASIPVVGFLANDVAADQQYEQYTASVD